MNTMLAKLTFIIFPLLLILSCSYEKDGYYFYDEYNSADGTGNFNPENTGDNYAEIAENPFIHTSEEPVSTFSIDADGASYANVRRWLEQDNSLPPAGAVRTEELINYFDLNYVYEDSGHPISLNGEISSCPWNSDNKLIRIGILGKPSDMNQLTNSNFVFLIDVSGSMGSEDKLDLLKKGFILFVEEMRDEDRVAIVTYSGQVGVALESTPGSEKDKIIDAIAKLSSGGSTAGGQGIQTAYEIAKENFIEGGNNRIIMGTDGDFNVGISDTEELKTFIEEKRESGVYLTVLGVGRGNYNDYGMEQLANHGNGTFEYIDKEEQLLKVFIYDYSKFYAVAKDVKVQVAFSPQHVIAYRLIGYENRVLNNEDFEDDSKDAGEIGAGQNITALYEIIPVEYNASMQGQPSLVIDFRYKMPDSDSSIPMELQIIDAQKTFDQASEQMRFTASVASFGMLLLDSQYKGNSSFEKVENWTSNAISHDPHALKSEFLDLVEKAASLR